MGKDKILMSEINACVCVTIANMHMIINQFLPWQVISKCLGESYMALRCCDSMNF